MRPDGDARQGTSAFADAALLGATAIWGGSFVLVRSLLAEISPLLFVALRFVIAALVLAPFALRRKGALDARSVRAGGVVGLWLVVGFGLQTVGLQATEPARAAFLTGLTVVLVPILLIVLHRRIPTAGSLVGVGLATAGLYLMTSPRGGGFSSGDRYVLFAAVSFAFQILAVARHAREVDPIVLLFWQIATSALVAVPVSLVLESPRPPATPFAWWGLLAAALLATVLCLAAQIWAQRKTPPTRAAVILTAEPVFAAAASYLVLGEKLGGAAIAGATLILAGMLAAELLPSARASG
jgi:drug/metabolite transporter (DMT)-like permease